LSASPLTDKRFSRAITALAVIVSALASVAAVATGALAQALPPNRFYGTVTIDGKLQPEGTVVEAYVGTTLCGAGSIANHNGEQVYLVDVLDSGQKPGCANDGDKVSFRVAGLQAKETATYQTGVATRLDLTASGTPRREALPTVVPPGGGGTPAPPPATASPVAGSPTSSAPPSPTAAAPASPAPGSATPTVTVTATPTATATATPTATSTPVARSRASTSRGAPAAVWIGIGIAVLLVLGGLGAWLYQRRAAP
jgi:hypothetical protein